MDSSEPDKPVPRHNKRRCRRQVPKRSAKAIAFRNALGLGPNVATGILDVSEFGARLLLVEQLRVGQEFEVDLETVATRPIKRLAVVVWLIEAVDGRFVTGVRFEKALSYADLIALSRQ